VVAPSCLVLTGTKCPSKIAKTELNAAAEDWTDAESEFQTHSLSTNTPVLSTEVWLTPDGRVQRGL
jgi:hypothetical protein